MQHPNKNYNLNVRINRSGNRRNRAQFQFVVTYVC